MASGNRKKEIIPLSRIKSVTPADGLEKAIEREQAWLQKEKLMAIILDSLNEGVFTIDLGMKVTSFNKAAERITGYTAQEAIGRNCMEVFCNLEGLKSECIENCPMKKTMQHNKSITKKRMICNKKGENLIVTATTHRLCKTDNHPIGGLEIIVDVTALEDLKERWVGKKYNMGNIIGKSKSMVETYQLIESISDSTANVLIQGETGTGKGLIASAIHYHSTKHKGPFVHVNCSALPENLLESELFGHVRGAFTGAFRDRTGKVEQAHKGTLFLDEIGEMSPTMQAKILRITEEKRFERLGGNATTTADIRIIAATNSDLEQAVDQGRFRGDLFYRLNIIPVKMPPLRQRMEDIPLLVDHFVGKFNYKMAKNVNQVNPDVLDAFLNYSWPGNVRELESAIEYAFVQCQSRQLNIYCLPPRLRLLHSRTTDIATTEFKGAGTFDFPLEKRSNSKPFEQEKVRNALIACRWKKTVAAERLGVSRSTLWRLMKKYTIP